MPRNLELKVHSKSFTNIKKAIKKTNAEYIGELVQKDIYYKTAKGLLKLRIENGQQSLIKYLRDEKGKDRWSDFHVLTFADGNAEELLKDIFDIETIVEKKRLLYMYNNTRIHLDEVKGLGKFLELETLVLKGLPDAKRRFKNTIDILDLDFKNQIKKSYKNLIEEKKK